MDGMGKMVREAREMLVLALEAEAEDGRVARAAAKMALNFFNEVNAPETAFSHPEAVALTVAFLGTFKVD